MLYHIILYYIISYHVMLYYIISYYIICDTPKQHGACWTLSRREVMWAAFRVFDTNGDGVITKDELAKILKAQRLSPALFFAFFWVKGISWTFIYISWVR